ncbi:MAG: DUF1573 domain-containing protein [Roseimicrobium sp.]
MSRALTALLALLCAPTFSYADIVPESDPIEVRPKPEDEIVDVVFSFTNTGAKPVTILKIDSSCACLEAALDKATYAAGEKGSGKAQFKTSSLTGRHEKLLHLFTDDPAAPEQAIRFAIEVPVVVSIEPNLLEWTVGEEPLAKEFTVKMLGKEALHITNISATRENVTFEKKEIVPGREYRISVKPASTADVTIGALKIETDSKVPKYSRQMAFFNIIRAELAEKKAQAKQR